MTEVEAGDLDQEAEVAEVELVIIMDIMDTTIIMAVMAMEPAIILINQIH